MTDGIDSTCRLLAASECAYWIGKAGGPPDCPQYGAAAFVSPPQTFQAGLDMIDACMVGKTADAIVLAFRGTLHFDIHDVQSLIDWINNFIATPVRADSVPGLVHQGFHNSICALWPKFLPAVKDLVTSGKPLLVTGHSKGAGLAPIATAMLHAMEGITAETVRMFAPPRPGNGDFCDYFNGVTADAVRYENRDDLVPHLPPTSLFIDLLAAIPEIGHLFKNMESWDYESVGTLKFIDWNGRVVDDSIGLELKRMEHLVKLVAQGKFGEITGDHALLGGYCAAVCPAAVCAGGD